MTVSAYVSAWPALSDVLIGKRHEHAGWYRPRVYSHGEGARYRPGGIGAGDKESDAPAWRRRSVEKAIGTTYQHRRCHNKDAEQLIHESSKEKRTAAATWEQDLLASGQAAPIVIIELAKHHNSGVSANADSAYIRVSSAMVLQHP